ncbi:hypothetical protein TBLA_0A08080 [Henningerozyma blattae CBS 6284]|uniref:Vacuolar protein 14 C-terminal Fig4-binding domain-containing protein n=1 Tax=Henningerozyma blattae (strain ATCC 34711 / CBS 6284 / DSM 70876 / NBRC 10599 / NRRL Y-10934 / UCD 77-7) TaxID=1071380 RepID=I2GWU6_HENB6|nr:hypothetical protein TBLA_0A08080 [Tetrapisispora blattae CBS 6284]CCH58598.1 hypothetical protein TBLA_0A08080 [Tetrapisispora blattae CBS 6284]
MLLKLNKDKSITKGLGDKIYEKRKATALELEKLVKQYVNANNWEPVDKIIDELCRDYAYALHQPMARNAGLIGLAATSIALGMNNIGRYLNHILPPVLACFGDQNDQVRFYACESLYNIAKVAKGEILLYFNEVFDVLCRISADSESSVKGAAELLDRLIKDIVAEKASNYISIVNNNPQLLPPSTKTDLQTGNVYQEQYEQGDKLAFSLPKFIPLLTERIYAINPDTRVFLVDWLRVLLNTPGLELISFLPSFLGGLFTFLSDTHKDVRTVTHSLLNLLLTEVNRIYKLKRSIRKDQLIQENILNSKEADDNTSHQDSQSRKLDGALIAERKKSLMLAFTKLSNDNIISSNSETGSNHTHPSTPTMSNNNQVSEEPLDMSEKSDSYQGEPNIVTETPIRDGEEYILGQDIHLNFPDIIEILINNLASSESEIQLVALCWIDAILSLSYQDFIPFLANILSLLLKLIGDSDEQISGSAYTINKKFRLLCSDYDNLKETKISYGSIVNSLTLQFFDGKVDAKIACLDWLLLIYRQSPSQLIEHNESMFLTLLTALSDNDARLIDRALTLLHELCSDSNESYLKKFIQDLLNLFKRDLKLFKKRGNYIMKQVCASLSPERIYKVVSSVLDTESDITFVKMVIQILSTNLITANEVKPLRNKLRTGEESLFFNMLFKWWCHNPISVLSLCLVSENYELAYSVLQSFVNYDLTVTDIVQLDVLVQLLESPVFTRMRLQLLENQKYPYLCKCLYGILMVLPQSKAFDILNKRLSCMNGVFSQSSPTYSTSYRNSSHTSINSESTTRSVSNSKHHYNELLDHFNKVRLSEEASNGKDVVFETKVPSFDIESTYQHSLTRKLPANENNNSIGNGTHPIVKIDTNDNEENNSVIFRSSTTSNMSRSGGGNF